MSRPTPPVVGGLLVALGGPALLAVVSERWAAEGSTVAANAVGQLVVAHAAVEGLGLILAPPVS